MIIVSVTYPASEGSSFNLDYYKSHHIPLVQSRWGACGLTGAQYLRGTEAPGGGPIAYHMNALLTFDSAAAFADAGKQHGREIMSDIKNFTSVKPLVQINELIE